MSGSAKDSGKESGKKVQKSEEEWREELDDEAYRILRKKGTEPAFSGKLWDNKEEGLYSCAGCGEPLFSSDCKFDSGTGWPSFDAPVQENAVATEDDRSLMMHRTEALCSRCGSHLGHVFHDGPPQTTGLRYCINSASLKFKKAGVGGE
ncbi:MAG: peptide-methionine (R)-S-oxide reductase MsrB [Pseudohongiellaceae bacterium]